MITKELLSLATERLVEQFHPQRIILFGSHARGTSDEHSDADILIVAPFTGKRREVIVEIDRALRGIGFARDIVLLTPEEFEKDIKIPGTVARPAYLEGKVLYERH